MSKGVDVISRLMAEYVNYGGPIVTRYEAIKAAQRQGYSSLEAQQIVLPRPAEPAPADPEAELRFLAQVEKIEEAQR